MSAPDGLPPLREVIRAHGLSARKSLGQNFLLDLNLTRRIARAAGPLAGVEVVEIGPGPGGLTRALLIEGAARVIAIERDPRCIAALEEIAACFPGRLDIVAGDALELFPSSASGPGRAAAAPGPGPRAVGEPGARRAPPPPLRGRAGEGEGAGEFPVQGPGPRTAEPALAEAPDLAARIGRPARIVANLPYNIGTELLVRWLTPPDWPPWWDSLTLMFQREVAERIVAAPGGRAYGRLSVLAQWRAAARVLFDVAPSAFTPPPKVTSAVLRIVPTAPRAEVDPSALERLVAAAFGQRRKMLRQSLKGLGPDMPELLAEAGIDPTRRAETVTVPEFLKLAQHLKRRERAGS